MSDLIFQDRVRKHEMEIPHRNFLNFCGEESLIDSDYEIFIGFVIEIVFNADTYAVTSNNGRFD